jgi:hypothetical protein
MKALFSFARSTAVISVGRYQTLSILLPEVVRILEL